MQIVVTEGIEKNPWTGMLAEHLSWRQIPLVTLTTGSSSEVKLLYFSVSVVPLSAGYGLLKRNVKMAGYWPRSFFVFLLSYWLSKGNKNAKKERGQCPILLTEQERSINDILYAQKENFFSRNWINNQT